MHPSPTKNKGKEEVCAHALFDMWQKSILGVSFANRMANKTKHSLLYARLLKLRKDKFEGLHASLPAVFSNQFTNMTMGHKPLDNQYSFLAQHASDTSVTQLLLRLEKRHTTELEELLDDAQSEELKVIISETIVELKATQEILQANLTLSQNKRRIA